MADVLHYAIIQRQAIRSWRQRYRFAIADKQKGRFILRRWLLSVQQRTIYRLRSNQADLHRRRRLVTDAIHEWRLSNASRRYSLSISTKALYQWRTSLSHYCRITSHAKQHYFAHIRQQYFLGMFRAASIVRKQRRQAALSHWRAATVINTKRRIMTLHALRKWRSALKISKTKRQRRAFVAWHRLHTLYTIVRSRARRVQRLTFIEWRSRSHRSQKTTLSRYLVVWRHALHSQVQKREMDHQASNFDRKRILGLPFAVMVASYRDAARKRDIIGRVKHILSTVEQQWRFRQWNINIHQQRLIRLRACDVIQRHRHSTLLSILSHWRRSLPSIRVRNMRLRIMSKRHQRTLRSRVLVAWRTKLARRTKGRCDVREWAAERRRESGRGFLRLWRGALITRGNARVAAHENMNDLLDTMFESKVCPPAPAGGWFQDTPSGTAARFILSAWRDGAARQRAGKEVALRRSRNTASTVLLEWKVCALGASLGRVGAQRLRSKALIAWRGMTLQHRRRRIVSHRLEASHNRALRVQALRAWLGAARRERLLYANARILFRRRAQRMATHSFLFWRDQWKRRRLMRTKARTVIYRRRATLKRLALRAWATAVLSKASITNPRGSNPLRTLRLVAKHRIPNRRVSLSDPAPQARLARGAFRAMAVGARRAVELRHVGEVRLLSAAFEGIKGESRRRRTASIRRELFSRNSSAVKPDSVWSMRRPDLPALDARIKELESRLFRFK
eukprot:gnl/Dysnectes_brevis/8935_a16259_211.p1 GENE.gnl/Dysnectes_brevis/8935_a16259_211~~gnl/Dysnectes_brevis/8935_a16259_211.p1  ORF type:complete len:804 (-),score=21.83 gnl/Dysnectes_brevis/8935_a16259_211:64-2271(-)